MKNLLLLSILFLSGCTTVRWYACDHNGQLTPKNPIFIDYKNECVQFETSDKEKYKLAVYMVEKIHVSKMTELISSKTYNLCGYEISSK